MLLRPQSPRASRTIIVWLISVLAALVVDAGVIGLIVLSSHFKLDMPDPRQGRAAAKAVTLRGLSAEQWQKNRGPAPRVKDERKVIAKNRDELPKPDRKPEVRPDGQVVDVAPGNNEVDPNAKFVAESNNTTKKETRAKEQTAFYRNAMPQRTATKSVDGNGTDAVENAKRAGNQGIGDDDRPLVTATPKASMQVPDVHKQQEVAIKTTTTGPGVSVSNRTETQEIKGNSRRLNLQPGAADVGEAASSGRAGAPGVLTLTPSAAVLDKITGAAANDHLQDVAEGDGTFLNTREWKYASFFNRVKQSVGQQWQPSNALRQRDPTGNVYGGRDRNTVLSVTLDQAGRLKDAYVEKSCGLDFLDLEAVKAFERAQPFPNPPPGLLANDQTIRFQFGFYLEMTGRPGMRLFRAAD